jgi:hypothetical protein
MNSPLRLSPAAASVSLTTSTSSCCSRGCLPALFKKLGRPALLLLLCQEGAAGGSLMAKRFGFATVLL